MKDERNAQNNLEKLTTSSPFKKIIKNCLITNLISLIVLLLVVIVLLMLIYVLLESKALEGAQAIIGVTLLSIIIGACLVGGQLRLLFFFYTLFVINNKAKLNNLNYQDFRNGRLLASISFNRYFTIGILELNSRIYSQTNI